MCLRNHFFFFICDKVALALPKQGVASLETLSIKENFLGKASSRFGFGCLAMHDNSPGSLCHATQASAWGYPSRVPCLTHGDGYLGILSCLARRPLGKSSILSSISASVQDGRMVLEGLPSGGPNTNLGLFPPCYYFFFFFNELIENCKC
jgi:hypothetical protein